MWRVFLSGKVSKLSTGGSFDPEAYFGAFVVIFLHLSFVFSTELINIDFFLPSR